MKIIISEKAFQWFQEEMEPTPNESIRFFVRYGGSSPFHEAFSLGITKDQPDDIGAETIINDIHFFIEKDDLWFFNNHHLLVEVDESFNELVYQYTRGNNSVAVITRNKQ